MKRNLTPTLLVGLIAFGSAAPAFAGSGAGAIVLSFPIGARYNALGEAGIALAQDATAAWFNPGGMAFLGQRAETSDVQLMYSKLAAGLAEDISLTWLGYAGDMGSGTIGFSVTYLDMGEQQATSEDEEDLGTFSSYEYVLQGNLAFPLSPDLGVGLGVKYFRDKLAPDQIVKDGQGGSAQSFGVDLGLLYKVPGTKLNTALAIANLGPNITHVDDAQSDPMPSKITAGLAYGLVNSEFMGLILVGDFQLPLYKWNSDKEKYSFGLETDQEEWGVGAEWNYDRSLFLRAGYKSAEYGDITDYTFGFGVDMKKWLGQALIFDFASVPQAEGLDRVSRFTLGYRW
ncbi:MAG TPA: PorV/PorQ family protein [Candidatus Krumholzibacteria bacterium]|nr:PorV/PorQ family protein [Candidatus Krumholzibacteria bacterium]HPD71442.1 PorV/PorQ family protein [Candidatus Krumholzibacteria bacterium]HRY41625.1 PorV/PorQ family protein [Candidatus Krumholzibacteria bacterium]